MTTDTYAIARDLAPHGTLRVSINLGNPVLAQGTSEAPAGITVDLAREIGARLDLPVELLCFDAARTSYEAMTQGRADLCFLAVEPAREAEVAFTAPYVVIEGVYAVPRDADLASAADVDRPGVRIGVKRGSAYDLFLTRTLRHASVVRGEEGVDTFLADGLEVAAGIRQPMTAYVAAHPELRLIEDRFMQIRQAVGTTRTRRPETVRFLRDLVEELKSGGFVADALRRSGQSETLVAPAAGPGPGPVAAELQCVVLDCPEPHRLAAFYAELLGGEVDRPDRRWTLGEGWATLHTPSGLVLAFQRVAEYEPPRWPEPSRPQQFHLDFGVPDLDLARGRVLAAGATALDVTDGRGWHIYADPAGHPFCLVRH